MSGHFWLGMAIIFVSGALNGSFAFPMKYSRRWRWENTWLVFAMLALLVFPCILAAGFVPKLAELYRDASSRVLLYPLLFGFLWGIAMVTFGLGISAVGMAVAIAVVSGLTCLFGSLIPLLVLSPAALLQPRGLMLLVGMPVLTAGLAFCGVAGNRREQEQVTAVSPTSEKKSSFLAGLGICIFTGVFGANINLGFVFGGGLLQKSVEMGASPVTATYAVWALVLGAGCIPNLLYCLYLAARNRTWPLFAKQGWVAEALLGVAMALLWLGGMVGYGIGATVVGKYGTSLGFAFMAAATIVASNTLGILQGEWKSTSPKTKKLLYAGIAFILGSVIILNLGGLFPTA
jgi:L-rhamnose-H+ transport protein